MSAPIIVEVPELNDKFDPRKGTTGNWLGADSAVSVPIGDAAGRYLWLFADTWWRTSGTGVPTNRLGSEFLNDSFAIQSGPDLNTATVTFIRRTGGGNWLPMPVNTHHAWPMAGLRVGNDMYIWSYRVQKSDVMVNAGWCLHRIPNVATVTPQNWAPVHVYSSANTRVRPIFSPYDGGDGYIYIFTLKAQDGWRRARWTKANLAAGVPPEHARLFDWVTDPEAGFQFADSFIPAEASFHMRYDGRWVLTESGVDFPKNQIQIRVCQASGFAYNPGNYYYPLPPDFQVGDKVTDNATGFVSKITSVTAGDERLITLDGTPTRFNRTTAQLTRRTGTDRPIYVPPEVLKPGYIYAGKAHPEIPGGGLVITYCDNQDWNPSGQPGDGVAYDLSTYWPKFIKVLPPKPANIRYAAKIASFTCAGAPDRLLWRHNNGAWNEVDPTTTRVYVDDLRPSSNFELWAIGVGGDGYANKGLPAVSAGDDYTLRSGQRGLLLGAATDPTGRIVSRQWTQTVGPTVTITNPNTTDASFIAPATQVGVFLVFRFSATDDGGSTAFDDVVITCNP